MNETASGTFIKVDFRYFISLALQNKIPWQSLPAILQDFTQTVVESKQVIKVLLKKLQELHLELEKYKKESNQNEEKKRKRRKDTISNWHCTYCGDGYRKVAICSRGYYFFW